MFVLDGGVLCFELAGETETAADGEAEKKKAEAGDAHGGGIESDGEGVYLLIEDIGGEEGQKR